MRGDEEARRILRNALEAHFEVQMRPGRTPGRADFGNFLRALNDVAGLDVQCRSVGVAGDDVAAMIDFHHVAELVMPLGGQHHAPCCSHDRRTGLGNEVDAFVRRVLASDRVNPHAEAGHVEFGVDRQHGGQPFGLQARVEQLGFHHVEEIGTPLHAA